MRIFQYRRHLRNHNDNKSLCNTIKPSRNSFNPLRFTIMALGILCAHCSQPNQVISPGHPQSDDIATELLSEHQQRRASCSWLGVMNTTTQRCECDDQNHRKPEELCAHWHHVITDIPKDGACRVGEREGCAWMGTCEAIAYNNYGDIIESKCTCDDLYHRRNEDSGATACQQWYPAPRQRAGSACQAGDRAFCNNVGYCSIDEDSCVCSQYPHRSPSENCSIYHNSPQADATKAPEQTAKAIWDGAGCPSPINNKRYLSLAANNSHETLASRNCRAYYATTQTVNEHQALHVTWQYCCHRRQSCYSDTAHWQAIAGTVNSYELALPWSPLQSPLFEAPPSLSALCSIEDTTQAEQVNAVFVRAMFHTGSTPATDDAFKATTEPLCLQFAGSDADQDGTVDCLDATPAAVSAVLSKDDSTTIEFPIDVEIDASMTIPSVATAEEIKVKVYQSGDNMPDGASMTESFLKLNGIDGAALDSFKVLFAIEVNLDSKLNELASTSINVKDGRCSDKIFFLHKHLNELAIVFTKIKSTGSPEPNKYQCNDTIDGAQYILYQDQFSSTTAVKPLDNDKDGYFTYDTDCAQVDCNDANANIFPGATEIPGNTIDENCDTYLACFKDNDKDGWGVAEVQKLRSANTQMATGAVCPSNDGSQTLVPVRDGYSASQTAQQAHTTDGFMGINGWVDLSAVNDNTVSHCDHVFLYGATSSKSGDCNDADSSISPSAEETAGNHIDENCDGSIMCFKDQDGDGFSGNTTELTMDPKCNAPNSIDNNDCNDEDERIHPGATEVTADGVDQNCDSLEICYTDADQDGYGSSSLTSSHALDCSIASISINNLDCDDTHNAIYPDAPELCDGLNNTCSVSPFADGQDQCPVDAPCVQGQNDNKPYSCGCSKNYKLNATTNRCELDLQCEPGEQINNDQTSCEPCPLGKEIYCAGGKAKAVSCTELEPVDNQCYYQKQTYITGGARYKEYYYDHDNNPATACQLCPIGMGRDQIINDNSEKIIVPCVPCIGDKIAVPCSASCLKMRNHQCDPSFHESPLPTIGDCTNRLQTDPLPGTGFEGYATNELNYGQGQAESKRAFFSHEMLTFFTVNQPGFLRSITIPSLKAPDPYFTQSCKIRIYRSLAPDVDAAVTDWNTGTFISDEKEKAGDFVMTTPHPIYLMYKPSAPGYSETYDIRRKKSDQVNPKFIIEAWSRIPNEKFISCDFKPEHVFLHTNVVYIFRITDCEQVWQEESIVEDGVSTIGQIYYDYTGYSTPTSIPNLEIETTKNENNPNSRTLFLDTPAIDQESTTVPFILEISPQFKDRACEQCRGQLNLDGDEVPDKCQFWEP